MLIQLGTQLSGEAGSARPRDQILGIGRSHLREYVLILGRRIRLTILFIASMHNVRFIVRLATCEYYKTEDGRIT